MTDLTFQFPATSGPSTSVDLTFGGSLPPVGGDADATFNAKFSLRGSVVVGYDTAVWRGLNVSVIAQHSQAARRERVTEITWQPGQQGERVTDVPIAPGLVREVTVEVAWQPPLQASRSAALVWGEGKALGAQGGDQWQYGTGTSRSTQARWNRAKIVGAEALARFGLGKNTPREFESKWQHGEKAERVVTSNLNRKAKSMPITVVSPWQTALVVRSDGGPRYLPPPPVVVPPRPDTVVEIKFCALYPESGNTTLIFGLNPCGNVTPDSTLYILPARYYMAVHSITAATYPGNVPVRITDVSLAADVDSTVWTFSARGPAELFEQLAPLSQIKVTIDGMEWVFLLDRVSMDEKFGARGTAIAGRSLTALVGEPYARQTSRLTTTSRNAQQIANDALALSGVSLDWGITDWLVPAGAWSHTGTPLAAVQAVAQAAGGYVNSHRSEPTILVRHPYPLLPGGVPGGPWNWEGAFAADVELAPDAIISKSIERIDGPDIDGVYVSGTTQGVLAHVFRNGTIGAKLAGMETDALITANAAAQQRGLAVLGAAGAKHMVQMTIPVLTGGSNPGVLNVGQLVQINEAAPWRGRVRSVSVQGNMRQVRQSFALERHLA